MITDNLDIRTPRQILRAETDRQCADTYRKILGRHRGASPHRIMKVMVDNAMTPYHSLTGVRNALRREGIL